MIFVDSNIPMYLVGTPHRLKADAQRLVDRSIAEGTPLVTDAEVLQEILHRYTAIHRTEAIRPAFDWLLTVADEVFPIALTEVERARDIVMARARLSARDALHLAVMERYGVERILSFDSGFDDLHGITRIWE